MLLCLEIFGVHLGTAVDLLTEKTVVLSVQLTEVPSYLWLFQLEEELKMRKSSRM